MIVRAVISAKISNQIKSGQNSQHQLDRLQLASPPPPPSIATAIRSGAIINSDGTATPHRLLVFPPAPATHLRPFDSQDPHQRCAHQVTYYGDADFNGKSTAMTISHIDFGFTRRLPVGPMAIHYDGAITAATTALLDGASTIRALLCSANRDPDNSVSSSGMAVTQITPSVKTYGNNLHPTPTAISYRSIHVDHRDFLKMILSWTYSKAAVIMIASSGNDENAAHVQKNHPGYLRLPSCWKNAFCLLRFQ